MTTKISPDDLLEALGSLKPEADDITNTWYIGRREHTLQQVLTRAAQEPQPATDAAPVVAPKRRHRRRAILASVATVAMLGGGAAWAYSNYAAWYTSGPLDGYTCMTTWAAVGDPGHTAEQYGGPAMTTDPVADCDSYADVTGKPRIVDPVAVRWQDSLVVGPRAGLPADAVPIGTTEDSRVFELEKSLEDYVDGGLSQCFDETTGTAFAHSELDRLGLADWTVKTTEQDAGPGQCALLLVPDPGVIEVRANFYSSSEFDSSKLIPLLRSKIAEQCLSLPEAKAVVDDALADDHHWATSTQVDPAAACTRVDLNVGGSIQVFLYGPETAQR